MAMMMTVMNMMMIMILMMIMIMIMTVIMIMITMMIMTKLLLRLMMTMMAASIAMPWPRVSAVLFGQHFNYGTSSESCHHGSQVSNSDCYIGALKDTLIPFRPKQGLAILSLNHKPQAVTRKALFLKPEP